MLDGLTYPGNYLCYLLILSFNLLKFFIMIGTQHGIYLLIKFLHVQSSIINYRNSVVQQISVSYSFILHNLSASPRHMSMSHFPQLCNECDIETALRINLIVLKCLLIPMVLRINWHPKSQTLLMVLKKHLSLPKGFHCVVLKFVAGILLSRCLLVSL